MKKKVLAFLLASTMVIEPFSVVGAADFSDGIGQDVVQFSDDGEDAPEVENDGEDADQFSTDAAGEGENSSKPSEDAIQMGDDVWFTFDDSKGTATISGTGDMWDYYENGYDYTNKHQNPFAGKSNVQKIVISEGVTNVGDYFLQGYEYRGNIKEISLSSTITKIGKYAFKSCYNVQSVILPSGLEEVGDCSFDNCNSLTEINVPDSVKSIGKGCFQSCRKLSTAILPDALIEIPESAFSSCSNLTEIILPSKLETIGQLAFSGCSSLKEITIPASIKNMGDWVFGDCTNLKAVDFEKGYSGNISVYMFFNCTALTDISIPEGVLTIFGYAFCDCSRLSTVTINGSKTRISSEVFRDCKNLRLIKGYNCSYTKKYYDSLTDTQKNSIKFDSLGEGQHEWTAEKVQIKEPTCTEKGIKAYRCEICGKTKDEEELPAYDHNWNNGVITKQATETEEGEIKYTCRRCGEVKTEKIPKLNEINFKILNQGWNNHYQYSFYCTSDKKVTYYVKSVKKDSEQPIYDATRHDGQMNGNSARWINVDIADEEAIDIYVFATNTNGDHVSVKVTPNYNNRPQKPVTKIKVGDNVTAIVDGDTLTLTGTGGTYDSSRWFEDTIYPDGIKNIIVEDGITSLGNEIFYYFYNVNAIKLPTSLRRIGSNAFEGCKALENLIIPEGVTELGENSCRACLNLKSISLPSTLKKITCFSIDDNLPVESIELAEGIEIIGRESFWNMNKLKTIIIPDSVTKIEESAFDGCTSLEKIVLPSKLTSLGYRVFTNCNAEITFPASLKYIPELGSDAVRKVTIPEGVETIGYQAFCSCSNLTEITLPSTIKNIESEAFDGTGITSFNYPQNIKYIPDSAFASTNLEEFSVPESVTEINDYAFGNCTKLTKISIPKSVTYIGSDVFKYCRNLTIYGYKDSAAESYAKANTINFISADYKVVFKDNGRTQKTEYVTKGQNATPPTLSAKDGYTLSWDADYTNITEDMVINAVWTKNDSGNGGGNTTIIVSPSETTKYTVTFKDRGKIVKTEKVKSGDAAEYPYINRNGYELSWDKDFSKVTANITVNAVWTVIKPNKVTSLTAEVQKNSIDLSWDRAENTDYYLVYRKATSDTEYKQIKKTTKILWTDEDVEPGTEYSYKVVGVCSVDGKKYQGADSDVVTAKIGTPQIGDVYSVGDLKYKVTGAKEVSVIGLAKEEVEIKIPSAVSISGKVYKVTSIQAKAFYQNEDIVSIAIGNNVTYVGKYAFYQCPNLETVKFGKRVSVISTCAFTQCPNLESVILPASVKRLGAKVFYKCNSIRVIQIESSALEYVGKKGLAVNKMVTLKLPKKVYTKYKELIKASGVYSKTKFVKS
ncbi:leucine-rich repeat protein [Blautia difficilis]|uniref:leucine-rich repeat protein n=1 Tax=Blautia difficilis TaxID=2763027 RepID=UPI003D969050